jgi:uncharacterized protein (DUF697 family)
MPESKSSDDIIKTHVIYAMTAGAIPVPVADFVAVSAIQYDLIQKVAEFHSVDYDSNRGKTLATSIAGASATRLGSSIVKALPGVGTLLGIASQVVISGATTYALGRLFDSHFANKGTLDNLNTDLVRAKYREYVEKGKEYAKNLKKNFSKDDVLSTIEKLRELKDSGAISEAEFESLKEKLQKKVE